MPKIDTSALQARVITYLAPESAGLGIRVQHLDAETYVVGMPKALAIGTFGNKIVWRQLQLFAHRRSASRKTMEPWFILEPFSLQEDLARITHQDDGASLVL